MFVESRRSENSLKRLLKKYLFKIFPKTIDIFFPNIYNIDRKGKEIETMTSRHYNRDRIIREKLIREIGVGKEIKTVRVDKGHPNGAELHTITTNGIIIIRNERTNKMITKLIARPNQIKRYDIEDKKVLEIARKHQALGYNMI